MYDAVEVIIVIATAFAGVVTGSVVTVWLLKGEQERWDRVADELIADRKATRDAADRVLRHAVGLDEEPINGHSDAYEDSAELREQVAEAMGGQPDASRFQDREPEPVKPFIPVQRNPYVFDFSWNPKSKVVHRTDCTYVTSDCEPLTSMGVGDLIAVMKVDGLRGCKICDPAREKERVE